MEVNQIEIFTLGEIRKGTEVGKRDPHKYITAACSDCGTIAWRKLSNIKCHRTRCRHCGQVFSPNQPARKLKSSIAMKKHWERPEFRESHSGENNASWKGGRFLRNGYAYIRFLPEDKFFLSMKPKGGYILEHRMGMAKHLGRSLHLWEIVHHKNGIKDDNRISNLELGESNGNHMKQHNKGYQDGYQRGLIDGQNDQIQKLKKEIEQMKSQEVHH